MNSRLCDDAKPLLSAWTDGFDAPPFDRIEASHFLPAFEAAIAIHSDEIAAIVGDPAPPDFQSVMVPLERAGTVLGRVRRVFWTLSSALATADIQALEGPVAALLTAHGTAINHDAGLFAKVAIVHQHRDALNSEQRRLVETTYKGFVQGGAGLGAEEKNRFAEIDRRLADTSVCFGQNVLAATADWSMLLTAGDIAGLPESLKDAAARRAERAGQPGGYLFTLDRGDMEGFLTFAERRDLRERMWRGFNDRCDGGEHDNNPLIAETARLREERARLLDYACFADLQLADSMAGTPEAAAALLMRVWHPARRQALAEATILQERVRSDGADHDLAAWDWRYYAQHVARDDHDVDAAAIQAHLSLDRVRDAAFTVAGRLYGLRFERRPDIPVYHPDVDAWAVADANGVSVGLLYTDYFARPGKHGGAWMGSLRVQEAMDGPVLPIVYTVANFARAQSASETRLALNEAQTLFHEFGHALHALLSNVTYPSLAGTAVARDFVEFPSKLMEHWIVAPAVLREIGVPAEVVSSIGGAARFGQGFATVEFVASAVVDLALHRAPAIGLDPAVFAADTLASIGMPTMIAMRHRLPAFTHVFNGGYASAYYSYLWSEVLDEDAFSAFVMAGDIFDRDLAGRLRREVLAPGDSRDPMDSFVAFMGRPPAEDALLRARGLVSG